MLTPSKGIPSRGKIPYSTQNLMPNRLKMDEIPKRRAKIPLFDSFSETLEFPYLTCFLKLLNSLIWSDHCNPFLKNGRRPLFWVFIESFRVLLDENPWIFFLRLLTPKLVLNPMKKWVIRQWLWRWELRPAPAWSRSFTHFRIKFNFRLRQHFFWDEF